MSVNRKGSCLEDGHVLARMDCVDDSRSFWRGIEGEATDELEESWRESSSFSAMSRTKGSDREARTVRGNLDLCLELRVRVCGKNR